MPNNHGVLYDETNFKYKNDMGVYQTIYLTNEYDIETPVMLFPSNTTGGFYGALNYGMQLPVDVVNQSTGLGSFNVISTTNPSYIKWNILPGCGHFGGSLFNFSKIEFECIVRCYSATNSFDIGFINELEDEVSYSPTSLASKFTLNHNSTDTFVRLNSSNGTTQSYGNNISISAGIGYPYVYKIVYTVGSNIDLYINGILVDTKVSNLPISSNVAFSLFSSSTGFQATVYGKLKFKFVTI